MLAFLGKSGRIGLVTSPSALLGFQVFPCMVQAIGPGPAATRQQRGERFEAANGRWGAG